MGSRYDGPIGFSAVLATGLFLGWLAARLIFNQRLTHHQELIANYRDVLEEKLPARSLRPFPAKRSKTMIFGLTLIFVGAAVVFAGALIVFFQEPSPIRKVEPTAREAVPPNVTSPAPPPAASANKVFIDKTARELLALYEGRTMLQADILIEPFKGKWIKVEGTILQLIPSGLPRLTTAVLRDGDKIINCGVGPDGNNRLLKLNTGDKLKAVGRIAPSQNGQQLYLLDCELVD